MFEDIELNPFHVALALVAGILSIIVMSKVQVGLLYKIFSFIGTAIVSYFIVGRIAGN